MIKIGLIGCGFMGNMHANCYNNIEGVKVSAVADVRPEYARAIAGEGVEIYSDGMDLINNADVDVIDICLPTYLHAEYAIAAMDKVKYVFVEKPVALTVAEAEAMIEKSIATGARVQVGQVIRFWDEYVELRRIIGEGKLGRVVNANFRRLSPTPNWGFENWLHNIERSGGAGQDLHVHDTDFVLSLFGRPESFFSVKNTLGEGNSYVNTLMKYSDFAVSVEGTWDLPTTHPFEATFRVVFERGVVENAGGKFMLYTADAAEEIKIEKKQLLGGYDGGNISDLGGYYNELVYFTDRIKANEDIAMATLPEATESLKFVLEEIGYGA